MTVHYLLVICNAEIKEGDTFTDDKTLVTCPVCLSKMREWTADEILEREG